MNKALLELFKAIIKLLLLLLFYTSVYGGLVYLLFGFLSLLGPEPLNIQRSLVCGFIILLSQNVYILIKKVL